MKYEKVNWKYVLTEGCIIGVKLPDREAPYCATDYFSVMPDMIIVRAGYAWDGASGPTVDTDNSMTASLIHDVLYQAIREGLLPTNIRRHADREFRRLLKRDGMSFLRRWLWWLGVRLFGGKFASRVGT